MITSFEVGAVFRIVNEASPAISRILKQVRELRAEIEKTRESMAALTKGFTGGLGLSAAIGETDKLAASWKNVAKSAAEARTSMGRAARLPAPGGGAAGGIGGGGRAALGNRIGIHGSGGGGHISNPAFGLPTGSHFRIGGAVGVAAAALAYAGYQASGYEDAAVMMAQHAGVDYKTNRERFEKILKDATIKTGYGEQDVSEAAQDVLRQFKYTGGEGGVDVLPQILRYGATEARLKGTGLKESESAMVGLAHMLKKYSSEDVEKLAPAFSVLSVANPMTLKQMDTAFGYAVPLLQSGMDLDPFQTMAASTALARAGIGSTKAGTWIRQMMKGAMPGTSLMSKMVFKKHEEALKELGLVDGHHKPTWFVDGKPDEFSFLKKMSENLPGIPVSRRSAVLEALAGTQGAGALAVLGEPAVQDQMKKIWAATQDPAEIARVRNFSDVYGQQSTRQNSRQTLQTFNVLMADLGEKILPGINHGLSDFKGILETIRGVLPHVPGAGALVGGRALEGIGLGAAGGFAVAGPPGAAIGAIGGGILGIAEGVMESYSNANGAKQDKGDTDAFVRELRRQGATGSAPAKAQLAPIKLDLNIDGRTLASTMSEIMAHIVEFSTAAPAADGIGLYNGGGQ